MMAPCPPDEVAAIVGFIRTQTTVLTVTCAHDVQYARGENGVKRTVVPSLFGDIPITDVHRRRIKALQMQAPRMPDAAYRSLLKKLTGKTSSTQLTDDEALTVIHALEEHRAAS